MILMMLPFFPVPPLDDREPVVSRCVNPGGYFGSRSVPRTTFTPAPGLDAPVERPATPSSSSNREREMSPESSAVSPSV